MTWQREVLVLEDEPLVSALLCGALSHAGFVAHPSLDALGAKDVASRNDLDAALIDISLGEGPSGVQFGQWLHRVHPHVALVFLTRFPDPRTAGLNNWELPPGATLLAKDRLSQSTAIIEALELALRQSPSVARHDKEMSGPLASLTATQYTILQLAARGLSNSAIAQLRGTSARTVEQRLQAAYRALNIENHPEINPRVQAIRIFIEAGGFLDRSPS